MGSNRVGNELGLMIRIVGVQKSRNQKGLLGRGSVREGAGCRGEARRKTGNKRTERSQLNRYLRRRGSNKH